MYLIIKSCPNPFKMQHMSENLKLKFSNLLSNLFFHNVNNWQILQSKLKVGLKKS
jgi:hypothetical protein